MADVTVNSKQTVLECGVSIVLRGPHAADASSLAKHANNRNVCANPTVNLALRAAKPADRPFVESVYFETQRRIIEKLFSWRGDEIKRTKFDEVYSESETSIVDADGRDVGWMSVRQMLDGSLDLDALYLLPAARNKGLGTALIQQVIERAAAAGAPLTVSTAKINPARRLYERLGFVMTHESEFKVFMEYRQPE